MRNLMLVTAQQNNAARGPSNAATKSLPGVKGVQARRDRLIVEFQCPGDRHLVPKICATLSLNEKPVALALYNRLARHHNGDMAFQNIHEPLTEAQEKRLQELFDECIARWNKRKALFEANGGRPTKKAK
jgi:hypothetical protein